MGNLVVVVLSLLCSIFAAYISYAESDTTNAIAAQHRQNKTFKSRKIWSEHHRQKYRKSQASLKYKKKRLSKAFWQQHDKILNIVVKGNQNLASSEIRSAIKPYLQERITQKQLTLISIAIEDAYLKRGYFLPIAYAELNDSGLKISIIEGKINNVFVILGDEERDKKVLNNQLVITLINKIKKQNPIKTKDFEKYVALINDIPGYKVEYDLELLPEISGNKVANLIMTIETKRGTADVSVDNKGTADIGKYQFDFTGKVFNLIANDSLTLNLGTTNKPKQSKMVTGSYSKQLNSYGTSATAIAAYLGYDPYDTSSSKDSKSNIFKGQINQYLLLRKRHTIKLEIGAEHRDVKRYSESNKLSDYKYVTGSIGGEIKITDPLGAENLFFPFFNWTLNNTSESTQDRDFDKDFNYFIVNWYREQPLPRNFSLFLKASYQYTNKLLPSEHLYSIGTDHTARGYKIGIVSAD
ncbi:MAG: ShlB/FhaC/HecB family hemolysin secretion/activation protein [Rickettsiales bacterium]|nr:ShlB/FhaC/HecB family hemolysin secretion/activation protein [Rickettsiales bacterium]